MNFVNPADRRLRVVVMAKPLEAFGVAAILLRDTGAGVKLDSTAVGRTVLVEPMPICAMLDPVPANPAAARLCANRLAALTDLASVGVNPPRELSSGATFA